MAKLLMIAQLVISVILMLLILTQNKDGGLSSTFGGGESFHSTLRGPEKAIFISTIVFSILFLVNALIMVLF